MDYSPRAPADTLLYRVVQRNLRTFLELTDSDPDRKPLPGYVRDAFWSFLRCGVLQHGFSRLKCGACKAERLVPFS